MRGISALLYLLYTSLKHYEINVFSVSLLSKFNDILELFIDSLENYIINILLDKRNIKLPVYLEKNEV